MLEINRQSSDHVHDIAAQASWRKAHAELQRFPRQHTAYTRGEIFTKVPLFVNSSRRHKKKSSHENHRPHFQQSTNEIFMSVRRYQFQNSDKSDAKSEGCWNIHKNKVTIIAKSQSLPVINRQSNDRVHACFRERNHACMQNFNGFPINPPPTRWGRFTQSSDGSYSVLRLACARGFNSVTSRVYICVSIMPRTCFNTNTDCMHALCIGILAMSQSFVVVFFGGFVNSYFLDAFSYFRIPFWFS